MPSLRRRPRDEKHRTQPANQFFSSLLVLVARPNVLLAESQVAADVHTLDLRLQRPVEVQHLADVELVGLDLEHLDDDPDLAVLQRNGAARADVAYKRHVPVGGADHGPIRASFQRDQVNVHRGLPLSGGDKPSGVHRHPWELRWGKSGDGPSFRTRPLRPTG